MITNDYEPEELQFVLPEVVKDTFPLELTFGNAENEKEIIKAVNEHFNVMFPENELAMRYMDNFEKDEISKHLRHPQKRRYRLCIPPGRTDFRIQWKHPPNPKRQH